MCQLDLHMIAIWNKSIFISRGLCPFVLKPISVQHFLHVHYIKFFWVIKKKKKKSKVNIDVPQDLSC